MKIVCRDEDVAEGDARRFFVGNNNLIVARINGKLHAYRNECPHMNLPLTNRSKALINKEQNHLVCAQHAAAFAIENGLCVNGPCVGMELEPVIIESDNGKLYLNE